MPVTLDFAGHKGAYRAAIREFLAAASPPSAVRRLMETAEGYDPGVWQEMADAGFIGRHLPSRQGGGGESAVELGILMEEMGAVLACAPMLSTIMATYAIVGSTEDPGTGSAGVDDAEATELLSALIGGRRLATVAVTGDNGGWIEDSVAVTASPSGRRGGWRLDGHAGFVLDGHIADVIIVAARTSGGTSLFLVDAAADGVSRRVLETVDQTRRLVRLGFGAVPGRLLGTEGDGWKVIGHVLDMAAAALGCEQAGGAGRCLEMSVEHGRRRVQFGRPIGSFQAVAHRCAEMLLEVESARVAARHACWAATHDSDRLPDAASMAKVCCSEAYAWVATETIQVHGGLGFTWDHDAHLYFRRARSSRLLFGDPRHHREILARRIIGR